MEYLVRREAEIELLKDISGASPSVHVPGPRPWRESVSSWTDYTRGKLKEFQLLGKA